MSKFKENVGELLEDSTKFWLTEQIRVRLKELRKEQDLTQAEVAEQLGKDQVFISNCESGRRRIDPIELLAFVSVYDISIQDLISNLDLDEAIERKYGPGA